MACNFGLKDPTWVAGVAFLPPPQQKNKSFIQRQIEKESLHGMFIAAAKVGMLGGKHEDE